MKKQYIIILWLILLASCQEKEVPAPSNESPIETFQDWWARINVIDKDVLEILVKDPEFIRLCNDLDKEKLIKELNEGILIDSVFKNYPHSLHQLIDLGLKHGVTNILNYKDYYLARLYPQCKDVIVEGECELKNIWIATHKTCRMAYEEGLFRFKTYQGCCTDRFKRSIENAMVFIPEAGTDICTLFGYVVDPALLNYECEYYANIFDLLNIDKNQRKNALLKLEREIEGIIVQISLTPTLWVSCPWHQKGSGSSSHQGGTDTNDNIPIEWPTGFPPTPDHFDKEYPPQTLDPNYEEKVTLKMTEELLIELYENANLQWFLDQYTGSEYEHAMSFKRNLKTGKYSRTEPRTDKNSSNVTFETNYSDDNPTVSVIHTHPDGGPHSIHDVLTLANMNIKSEGLLSTSIVGTKDNLYTLYVKDPVKAQAFHKLHSNNYQSLTKYYQNSVALINNQLGGTAMDIDDMFLFAKAAVLDAYNTGIVILKQDQNGKQIQYKAHYNDYIIEMSIIKNK